MAKNILPTDYKDDLISESMNGKRRYRLINNPDGTISLEDVTEYEQLGSLYGAKQINSTNQAVNESFDKNKIVKDMDTIQAMTQEGYVPDALALKALNDSLEWYIENGFLPDINSKALVPTMTSNTAPYGEVIFSNEHASLYRAYKAFDGDNTSRGWVEGTEGKSGGWIGYKFINPVKVTKILLGINGSNGSSFGGTAKETAFRVEASNDGSNYTQLFRTTISASETMHYNNYYFTNANYYTHYRVFFENPTYTSGDSNQYSGINCVELQFYGR